MKFSELHRIIKANGWIESPQKGKGSHRRYTKDEKIYTVPFHQEKEIGNDFAKRLLKEMGL